MGASSALGLFDIIYIFIYGNLLNQKKNYTTQNCMQFLHLVLRMTDKVATF